MTDAAESFVEPPRPSQARGAVQAPEQVHAVQECRPRPSIWYIERQLTSLLQGGRAGCRKRSSRRRLRLGRAGGLGGLAEATVFE